MNALSDFYRDLRRRKVFRGTGFYIVGAWSLVQVLDVLGDPLGFPPWTLDALLFVAVVGFPLAVWVAWRYELEGGRLVRTQPARLGERSKEDLSLGALDYLVLAALIGLVGFFGWRGLESIRLSSDAELAPTVATTESITADDNTIAVLPFADLSPNADHAYLADGVSDTVLHVLSRVPELAVTSRTSSFAFRDQSNLTAPQIAAALGVAHVLEGSVQRAGDQVRVIARVIDARSNREVWSGNFDRGVEQIFAIQDEIAESVATALKVNVVGTDEPIVEGYQPTLEAYREYILGRRELERDTVAATRTAIGHFEQAIAEDENYALAYIGLHEALRKQVMQRWANPAEVVPRLAELVDEALAREPTLAEAWVARGGMALQEKDFEAARAAIDRAIELNPSLAEAYSARWNLLLLAGDGEGQLQAIRKAIELDPESREYPVKLAETLWSLARAEQAMATLKDHIREHPDFARSYLVLSWWLTQYGRPGEGMRYLQALRGRDPENLRVWKVSCEQFLQFWDFAGARQCFEAYLEANPDDLDARKWLAANVFPPGADREQGLRQAVAIGQREVEGTLPNQWYPRVQLADNLLQLGEHERVIALLVDTFPQLAATEPKITDLTQWPAKILGIAYWKSGQKDKGRPLIDAVLAHIERSRKLKAGGWIVGVEDAELYCVLDENQRCLDSLAAAVDSGWLFYSLVAVWSPAFDIVRDDARYVAIIDRLEANARDAREHYYAHRDEPVI